MFVLNFLPVEFKNSTKDDFLRLKQVGNCSDCIQRFNTLHNWLNEGYMSEEGWIDHFVIGLKKNTQTAVNTSRADKSNLAEAQKLALNLSNEYDYQVRNNRDHYLGRHLVITNTDAMDVDEINWRTNRGPRDWSKVKCWKCKDFGHPRNKCPKVNGRQ